MEAVGRLAGGVAHDFNNLLSIVLGYTTFALESIPAGPVRDDLQEVMHAGQRAAELTRQLLTFSRQQVFQPSILDLAHVVLGVEKMLKRVLGEDIELILDSDQAAGKIAADPGQVEQVLMNLVVNARDAMPRGGTVLMRTENVTLDDSYSALGVPAGEYVLLSVADTGTGMDAATQARVFEPFFTTKGVGKGTGLGLSTVYGIVKQSRGHVALESELGKGSTFKIYFPRTDQLEDERKPISAAPASMRGCETVLVVEDEDPVRRLMCTVLRRLGYEVLEAKNGGEAFLICEKPECRIDLLVTDVVMPRMSGRELVDRLAPTRPNMHVLYVSGYADAALAEHGVHHADAPFLQKPITPDVFARKVREVLGSIAPR
jgi:CheY-like chemotaxis protein